MPVEIRQAGDTVLCECGASLEVPTLRELREYASVPMETEPESARTWQPRHGLALLGFFVALLVAIPGFVFWAHQPDPPRIDELISPQVIQDSIEQMTVMETWYEWRAALELGLVQEASPHMIAYRKQIRTLRGRMALCFGVAGLAIILSIAALLWRTKPQPTS